MGRGPSIARFDAVLEFDLADEFQNLVAAFMEEASACFDLMFLRDWKVESICKAIHHREKEYHVTGLANREIAQAGLTCGFEICAPDVLGF